MTRMVKKLSGLEIDEVSLVDRPANQHGLVAIAKRQEDGMTIFDGQGNEVDETELEHGDVVYDDDGNELVFVEEEGSDGYDDGDDVDKAWNPLKRARQARAFRSYEHNIDAGTGGRTRMNSDWTPDGGGTSRRDQAALRAAMRGRAAGRDVRNEVRFRGEQARELGRRGRNTARAGAMQYRALPGEARAGIRYGGAAAGGAGAEHERRKHFGKSLGDQVLEDLSKALTDDARDEVIAKAADSFEYISKRNEALEDLVYQLVEEREAEQYEELAKGYEIGDPSEVGGLLYRAAQVLPAEDVAALDRVFSGYGEIAKGYMEEVGYNGYADSDIMAQVAGLAGEVISKSSGAMTQEQAVTALFDANPAAYDEYEAEQRLR